MQRATVSCKFCGKQISVERNPANDKDRPTWRLTLICPNCEKDAQYQLFELKPEPNARHVF